MNLLGKEKQFVGQALRLPFWKGKRGARPTIDANIMKTKLVPLIAALGLLPIAGFTQPPPNPPNPPNPPGQPPDRHDDRHERMPKVPVTYLGVETSEVPRVLSEQLGLAKGFGLVVDYVVPDSPATAAGVQQNDIIKMLNDQILTDPEQLAKLVRSYGEGTSITLTVLRKGQELKITVKLAKKEVPQRSEFGPGRHWRSMGDYDFGDFGMNDLRGRMRDLKKQLGDEREGMIHDAVVKAQREAMRARDEGLRAAEEGRRIAEEVRRAGRVKITRSVENGLQTTNIDIGKAQIVFSDGKGELRIEKIDGKKVLTAKDPQGLLLFSGPVESKEDLDKVPAEVRQRYEKLQQNDLPAVMSSKGSDENDESVEMNGDIDDDEIISAEQV
jgi:hypothetical protein